MSTCPLASPDRPAIEAVLFDLDDTLYRIEEIPQRVRENIEAFMVDRLKINPDVVPELCQHCYVNYGTTLAGLVLTPHAPHHEKHRCQQPPKQQQESGAAAAVANGGDSKDPDPVAAASAELAAAREEDSRVEREMHEFYKHWHDEVHASLPYESLFPHRAHPKNLALKALLDSIPSRVAKLVFTNADDAHAARCLELMGLSAEGDFDEVITFESTMRDAAALGLVRRGRPVVCKPADVSFRLALRAASRAVARKRGEKEGASESHPPLLDPASVAFFDDSTRNVAGAAASGIFSVLVGRTGLSELEAPGASAQLASVLDLPVALPSLWTRHGAEPPADLLRGGRLRSEEEREADGARARAARGAAETAEQVRNALSRKNVKARRRRSSSAEEGSKGGSESPVPLVPA